MIFLKTLLTFLICVALFLFWWSNEQRIDLDLGFIVLNARVATYVIAAFLIGFVPLWLYYRTLRWRLKRRIASLESQAAIPYTKPVDSKPVDTKSSDAATIDNSPLSSV